MNEVLRTIGAGFAGATWLDQANLALGIFGVVLMIRRSLWAFPVGLAAVAVQGVLFWDAQFPADAAVQVFFFVTLAWGWRHWVRDRGAAPELPVTRLGSRGILVTLGLAGSAMSAWVFWVAPHVGAQMPWRDAFIAAFSVAAQVLQARKNIENWPVWLVVNAVAVASYWKAELAYTAFLYAVYFFLAMAGWRSWRVALRAQADASLEKGVRE
ncbi:nicotinamide mononucleotide transporter [Nibricoccus aquaticus]|uniref:Nicotinamide riboside transporter PnuC n=1 Tax=Nibricoccus aquaticus TaxID=2576891 RepID=A0A290Q5A1_9BACT|nr:nicotinamide riboside transporter PnuC [Nibricoccus aquaticus]ATC63447.1 nicotinamide mononucleotide transporter [Nibricoccus aquaticus]